MDDVQLRLDCVRIASENLKAGRGQAIDAEVLEYAEKLFQYIWKGEVLKMAA